MIDRPKIQVICTNCKTYFDEEKVEFIDILEDIQKRDLLKFKCPKCKIVNTSYRFR